MPTDSKAIQEWLYFISLQDTMLTGNVRGKVRNFDLHRLAIRNWAATECQFAVSSYVFTKFVISRVRLPLLLVFASLNRAGKLFAREVDKLVAFQFV
jgi:hypothetical protein